MKHIKTFFSKQNLFLTLLFISMSLCADSLDKETNMESNVKLSVKVMASKAHEAPNGKVVYPVEYTILNQTDKVLYVFYLLRHHELMIDSIKENGIKEEIYPRLLMGGGPRQQPIVVKPNEFITQVNDIPADIFDAKNYKLVGAVKLVYITGDDQKLLEVYSDPLPVISSESSSLLK